MLTQKNKKAQEEMMGFVLIVVIVVIMGLVFFVFTMRQSTTGAGKESGEMEDMLQAMIYYTTNCSINERNQNVDALIKDCVTAKRICSPDGNDTCKFLNSTLRTLLDQFMGPGETLSGLPIHGYNMTFIQNNMSISGLPPISAGIYNGSSFVASQTLSIRRQNPVEVRLKCWYSQSE